MESTGVDPGTIIYTDGSCNPEYGIGGWASLILSGDDRTLLHGYDYNTTHNRMELLSAIRALEHVEQNCPAVKQITIYSDSQYLVQISKRMAKLKASAMMTSKGMPIQNADLVGSIILYIESRSIVFVKVKGHQKNFVDGNFNRIVDKLSRKIVREKVSEISIKG